MLQKFLFPLVVLAFMCKIEPSQAQCIAIPGDANGNGTINLADPISVVNYVFSKPGWSSCASNTTLCWLADLKCRGDANADGSVSLADAICLVNFVFHGASLSSSAKPCPTPPIDGCCCTPQPTEVCCLPVPGCP